jgi:hypothetical protein
MFFAVAHQYFVFVFIIADTNPGFIDIMSGTDITGRKSFCCRESTEITRHGDKLLLSCV